MRYTRSNSSEHLSGIPAPVTGADRAVTRQRRPQEGTAPSRAQRLLPLTPCTRPRTTSLIRLGNRRVRRVRPMRYGYASAVDQRRPDRSKAGPRARPAHHRCPVAVGALTTGALGIALMLATSDAVSATSPLSSTAKATRTAPAACSLEELATAAERGVGRVRGESHLLFSFLHQAGLAL